MINDIPAVSFASPFSLVPDYPEPPAPGRDTETAMPSEQLDTEVRMVRRARTIFYDQRGLICLGFRYPQLVV
jgi:hypothetical protein